jgi:hypothetical protein
MTSSPCRHLEAIDSRIPIHGSSLVLCPFCWEAFDPSPESVPPRFPKPKATILDGVTPLEPVSRTIALRKILPHPTIPELPEEFGIPRSKPWFTFDSGFLHDRRILMILILCFPFILYALWFYLSYYPKFEEFTDPTRQYLVAFPSNPMWTGGSEGGGSDGLAIRDNRWVTETYMIHVRRIEDSRLDRIKDLNSQTLALDIRIINRPDVIRSRSDVLIARAAAQYEKRKSAKLVEAVQIMVVNGFVYEMTVSGQNVSLQDSRVQRFFNSFKLARH